MFRKAQARFTTAAVAAALLTTAACSGILDVEAPGRLADEDLDNKDAVSGLVVGMSNRMATLMGSITSNMVIFPALLSGEMFHGGSYAWAEVPRGTVDPEDTGTNWGAAQVARWVAEDGLRRMQRVLEPDEFERSPYVARAYLFAAVAYRHLAENMCTGVIDGGAAESWTVYLDRGIDAATNAIAVGTTAGSAASSETSAAYGARASLKAWSGDWAGAVADAQQVPASLVFDAVLQLPDPDNLVTYETHDRGEYTVFSTFMSDQAMAERENMNGPAWQATHENDPRAPWTILLKGDGTVRVGANGNTPWYQQRKYDDGGSDIPLVKGSEMLVLRAEAALRNGDIMAAYDLLNQARDVYGMEHLTPAADLPTAWKDLHYERSATTWLEARHLWDSARWFEETGPAHSNALEGRDRCLPISKSEIDSNPKLTGLTVSHPLTKTQ